MIAWGSGLLVQYADRFWVFSASHVFTERTASGAAKDHTITPFWLPGRPGAFEPLESESIHFAPDRLDLAFVEISRTKAEGIMGSGHKFLPLTSINTAIPDGGSCLVTGYPEKLVDPDGIENTIETREFYFRSRLLTQCELQVAGINPMVEVGVDASVMTDDATGKNVTKLDLHGLSGGVIWLQDGPDRQALAIVKEHAPGKLIVGTRIRLILDRMKQLELRQS